MGCLTLSFEGFALQDGSPIYTQIVRFVQRGAAAGTVRSGDELPSRRTLSALLGVNPNTVQKAYRILEEEGLIASRSGAASCVVLDEAATKRIRAALLERDAAAFVDAMEQMGVSRDEALAAVEKSWR